MVFREKATFFRNCNLWSIEFKMDHSKFIALIQKEELFSELKGSERSLNYMYIVTHQILLMSCWCNSLNCIHSKTCKFHAESTPLCCLFLVTNIEWGKPTGHATCSYIDSSGHASGPNKFFSLQVEMLSILTLRLISIVRLVAWFMDTAVKQYESGFLLSHPEVRNFFKL